MNIIRDNFLHIVGREPTDKETAYISGLIKANNVRDDDAFLSILVIDYASNVANSEAMRDGNEAIKSTLNKGYRGYLEVIEKAKNAAEETAKQSIENVAYQVVNDLKAESVKVISDTAKKSITSSNQWSLFWVITGLIVVYAIGMFNGYVFSLHQLPRWLNSDSKLIEIVKTIINAPAGAIVLLYAGAQLGWQELSNDGKQDWIKWSVSFLLVAAGLFFIISAH